MPDPRIKLSDALRVLMNQQKRRLQANRGEPDQGKCEDCKRWIKATELAVNCDRCKEFICINCVDAHDHLHVALSEMGLAKIPGVIEG